MKQENIPPHRSKTSGSGPGRALYTAFLAASSLPLLCQQAMAATTVWEKASEIMKDVYTQILSISTIAAIVTAAIALLMMNFSRSGRTVDESRAWLNHLDRPQRPGLYHGLCGALLLRRPVDSAVNRLWGF